jgi:hypothetical protein
MLAIAQPTPILPALAASTGQPVAQQQSQATEVAVLKAQLATMQFFTDRLLATVYWSLGAVVVVAGLLIGFGWFSSLSVNERDIASLRSELAANQNALSATTRDALEAAIAVKISEMAVTSKEYVTKTSEDLMRPVQASVSRLTSSLERLQTSTDYTKYRSVAWYWEARGVKGNELTQYINILELAVQEGDSFEISESLKKIQELLNAGTKVMSSTITKLVALLDSLPKEQSIHAEALREVLRTTKTY